MELIKLHEGKLKIALTAAELHRYGLTVERFDYSNVETKRALWQMLDEAKREVGFDAADASLYVELFPSRLGGCEIFVTKLDKKKRGEERGVRRYVLSFEESEPIIALSAALTTAGYRAPSPLYRYRETYYLVLTLDAREQESYLIELCEEFGRREDEEMTGLLTRMGQLLCADAIVCLGQMILHHS